MIMRLVLCLILMSKLQKMIYLTIITSIPSKIPQEIISNYFIRYDASLRNSFRDEETFTLFLQMIYQLLLTHQFPFKAKKMLCQGASNSGKSAWVTPILQILDEENHASITREGKFSAGLINQETEIIFVDELTPGCINMDEFKGILQGGWLVVPQKHSKAERIVYASGVYLTCNQVISSQTYYHYTLSYSPLTLVFYLLQSPDFGTGLDGEAMENRLQRFNCTKLPHVDKSVKEIFVKDAMKIIHWIASKLDGIDLFENKAIGNPPYEPIEFRPRTSDEPCRRNSRPVIDLTAVQTEILPTDVIEVCTLY